MRNRWDPLQMIHSKITNDNFSNKGHAPDDIKYIAVRCAVVGGGDDPPIGGIPYTPPPSNATMLRALVDTDT